MKLKDVEQHTNTYEEERGVAQEIVKDSKKHFNNNYY